MHNNFGVKRKFEQHTKVKKAGFSPPKSKQTQETETQTQAQNYSAPFKYKTVTCKYWLEGTCGRGDKCTFSHELMPKSREVEACRYFQSGTCLKGTSCPFSHDVSTVPCKFFHVKGHCYLEDSCPYSHNPITKEIKERLVDNFNQYRKYDTESKPVETHSASTPLPKSKKFAADSVVSVAKMDAQPSFTTSNPMLTLKSQTKEPEAIKIKLIPPPTGYEFDDPDEQLWIEQALKKYKPLQSPF